MNKIDFSYERFCEYIKNKMSVIYMNNEETYSIITDTQDLIRTVPEELGMLTEEGTLRYIYDNKLFDELNDFLIQATTPYMYREAYKKLNPEYQYENLDNYNIKKGDYVSTAANNYTLVLKIEGEDAVFFTGTQFIIAHGIKKEGDKVHWNWGEYFSELPALCLEL